MKLAKWPFLARTLRQAPRGLTALLFAALCIEHIARAEDAEPIAQSSHDGYVCLGYYPSQKLWGWMSHGKEWIECPPNYAYFGVDAGGRKGASLDEIQVEGNCCPLPHNDILIGPPVTAVERCPDGYIVTGVQFSWEDRPGITRRMRCSAVNQDRYALGPERGGVRWGVATRASFPWREQRVIRRNQIPAAIRDGIGRSLRNRFELSGCVGDPIGSLFTGKAGRNCEDLRWRTLYYRNADGGRGQPVTMFPQCRRVSDPFDPQAECIR